MKVASQPSLFDADPLEEDQQAASAARLRMTEMIARLKAASEPYWRDEAGVILDDGAFRRAMRHVPAEEAQAFWVEFDVQMERLYAIWAQKKAS